MPTQRNPWNELCPQRVENGKHKRHNWQRHTLSEMRNNGYSSMGRDYGEFDYNAVYCNFCHVVREDLHACDQFTSYHIGSWPHYRNCDKRADTESTQRWPLSGGKRSIETGHFWLCAAHTVERMIEKDAEKERRENVRWNVWSFQHEYGSRGKGYEDTLVEVAKWVAHNQDLVASDEWLREIATAIGKLPKVIERLPEVPEVLT